MHRRSDCARAPRPGEPTVILSPAELAALLAIPEDEAELLSPTPVAVLAEWPAYREAKLGPIDLSPAEVGMILGLTPHAVVARCKAGAVGCRKLVSRWRIAPAALVLGFKPPPTWNPPVFTETPTQRRRRFEAAQKRVDRELNPWKYETHKPPRPKAPKKRKPAPDVIHRRRKRRRRRKLIAEYRAQGMGLRAIARALGIHPWVVYDDLKLIDRAGQATTPPPSRDSAGSGAGGEG